MRNRWGVVLGSVALIGVSACTVSKVGGVKTYDTRDAAEEDTAIVDTNSAEDTRPEADTESVADTADDDGLSPPECPWVGYGEGLKGGAVSWIGVDPRNSGVMFAVAGGLLSRSTDRGVTWTRWAERDDGFGVLAFPSDDPKAVLSTSGSGLLASADGGAHFDVLALEGFGLRSLLVHPAAPQRVYAGTWGAGILRSDDQGETWMAVNVGVPLAEVRSLAAPAGRVEVAVAAVVLLNENLGLSGGGQLLATQNGGLSWTVAMDGVGWGNDVVFCDDDTAYAAVRQGVAKSVDGGATFAATPGFAALDALHVAVSPDCQTVYTMVYQKGLYRSRDGGDTVEGPFTTGLDLEPDRQRSNSLVLDPTAPNRLFMATYAGLYRSEDAGESWAVIDSGNGVAITSLAVSAAAPGRVVASTWGSGAWLRHGADTEWVRVPSVLIPRDFIYGAYLDPVDPQRFFIGTTDELWRTVDGGATYGAVGLRRANVLDMAFLDSGDLLAATQTTGVNRSITGGDTWATANDGLAAFATPAGTFIDTRRLARAASGRLYLGTNGGGLFTSDDKGAHWDRVDTVDSVDQVTHLVFGPGDPAPLYAVVPDVGVLTSDDGGLTWTGGSSGLASLDVSGLVVDPATGDLYAATRRDGVFRSIDAVSWSPYDRWCLTVSGFDALTLMSDDDGTWLVGAQSGGTVLRHRLLP